LDLALPAWANVYYLTSMKATRSRILKEGVPRRRSDEAALTASCPKHLTAESVGVTASRRGNTTRTLDEIALRIKLMVVYDHAPVEPLGAADAIGSILKGISKVTDCGILHI
jgi:hypothetical protein